MCLQQKIILILFLLVKSFCASSQNNEESLVDIFEDLPIYNPEKNSKLLVGEVGTSKIKANILVSGSLNKSSYFVGEPILLTYELLSGLNSKSTISILPSFNGFLTTHLDSDNSFPKIIDRSGKKYRSFVIKRFQLIPFSEGLHVVNALEVNNVITFRDGNKSRSYSGVVSSALLNVKILPLPAKGRCDHFNGAVGDFKITATLERDTVKAGEVNSIKIEVSGSGNFHSLQAPETVWPDDFQVFDPLEQSKLNDQVFPATGIRYFYLRFVADQPGTYGLPAINLCYFDHSSGLYKTSKSDSMTLVVKRADPKPAVTVKPENRGGIHLFSMVGLALVFLSAVAFFIIRLSSNKNHNAIKKDLPRQINVLSAENASIKQDSFQSEIEELEKNELNDNFVIQFKILVINILKGKLGLPNAWPQELVATLRSSNVQNGIALENLLAECDRLLYGKIIPDKTTRESLVAQLKMLLNNLNSDGQL